MKYIFLFLLKLFIIFNICNGEPPPSLCDESLPFRLNDRSCANFNEICIKRGDDQCNQLQNACKQCPPSNITLKILQDILKISKLQSNATKQIMENKIPKIIVQLNTTQQFMENKMNAAPSTRNIIFPVELCPILLMIIIIILVVQFLETRFKIITKCFRYHGIISSKWKYNFLQSRKFNNQNEQTQELKNHITKIMKKLMEQSIESNKAIDLKFQELKDQIIPLKISSADIIDSSSKQLSGIQFLTVKFQFDEPDHKSIELYVHNNYNVVQVKQQICAKLVHAKQDDYKKMKLMYNGTILDDNDYLLKYINCTNVIVNCVIDSDINTSDIIVKLQSKMRVPDVIQINKHQNIAQLKEIISKIISLNEFLVFKITETRKLIELKDEDSVANLIDGDWIQLVTKKQGKLIIKSIFEDEDSSTVVYFNTNLVSSLTESVANKNNSTPDSFVLFCNNICLDEKKFIFQYEINDESPVKFCCFGKYNGIVKDNKFIEKGAFWELYNATDTNVNKKVLIKKFHLISSKIWKNEESMLNELNTFVITKSHQRFIQLFGVYTDDNSLYICMENMTGGTMKMFLKKHASLNKTEIYKWSSQILEGLKCLHEHKIIHRDLNPSSILVDDKNDFKLSSFNWAKYQNNYGPCSIMGKANQQNQLKVRYMAPEILNSKEYGMQCDVWSFGAVLIRIVTGKKPYPKLTNEKAKMKIIHSSKIEYDFPDKLLNINFKFFIDSCLKSEPDEREEIDTLIKKLQLN